MAATLPAEIRHYYDFMVGALEYLPSVVFDAGVEIGPERMPALRFLTPGEIDEELSRLRRELDAEVTLALLAAYEGRIMEDFVARSRGPKSATGARAVRALRKNSARQQRRVDIEYVLDVWRQELSGVSKEIGSFRQRYRHRHWLAHGRLGPDMSGVGNTDPDDVWHIGNTLLEALGID